jgi:DNA modification methylase
MNNKATIIVGDNRQTLKTLEDQSVQCVITSPPYWGLRDYGHDDQIGLEAKPDDFIEGLCLVFDEVYRVLKNDGTLWVNMGDSYSAQRWSGTGQGQAINKNKDGHRDINPTKESGLPDKNLVGIPWKLAFALQARGWILRQDIIWAKPNPMPESVTDRLTKSHEYIFLLTKAPKYYFDNEAIKEPAVTGSVSSKNRFGGNKYADNDDPKYSTYSGNLYEPNGLRNKRDVWTVNVKRYKEAHFATYPPELILPCVLSGTKQGDLILDPFSGAGTTGVVALNNGRNYIGLELNPEYAALSAKRITNELGLMGEVEVTQ